MADAPNTVSTLNGLFKEVYGDDIATLVPEGTKLQKHIPFVQKQKENGGSYHQPVLLAYEAGFTHAGASAGAFSLSDAAAGVMKDATVTGSQIVLRAQMDYESAARAAKGRNSFKDATSLMLESMQKSMRKRLECQLMYGQQGIGTVSALAAQVITLTAASFASGIWAGAEGMSIDVYTSAGVLRQAGLVVSSVDLDARTVTVTGTTTGIVATDVIYFAGAFNNEMAGVEKILTNSGSLFGISAASYNLWKGTSYDGSANSGAISVAKIGAAVAKAVAKGLDGEVVLLLNPRVWNNLASTLSDLRRIPGSVKNGVDVGSKSIEIYSQNGLVSIEPSIYVKESLGFGIEKDSWKRLGASDVTMKTPGFGEQIFFHLPTKAGFEVRAYTNQAIFSEAPGKSFLITGLVAS